MGDGDSIGSAISPLCQFHVRAVEKTNAIQDLRPHLMEVLKPLDHEE